MWISLPAPMDLRGTGLSIAGTTGAGNSSAAAISVTAFYYE